MRAEARSHRRALDRYRGRSSSSRAAEYGIDLAGRRQRRLSSLPGGCECPGRARALKGLLTVAALEQRDHEAGGERIACGRAVDGLDLRRAGAGDLFPVVDEERALLAKCEREERSERTGPERVDLERIGHDQVGALEDDLRDLSCQNCVEAEERINLRDYCLDRGILDLELADQGVRLPHF